MNKNSVLLSCVVLLGFSVAMALFLTTRPSQVAAFFKAPTMGDLIVVKVPPEASTVKPSPPPQCFGQDLILPYQGGNGGLIFPNTNPEGTISTEPSWLYLTAATHDGTSFKVFGNPDNRHREAEIRAGAKIWTVCQEGMPPQ